MSFISNRANRGESFFGYFLVETRKYLAARAREPAYKIQFDNWAIIIVRVWIPAFAGMTTCPTWAKRGAKF
jgi:hypothetical protein